MANTTIYDVIIIGAGPAGLTACLYALRSRQKVLLIDKMQLGGYLVSIDRLENYPGFPEGIAGIELVKKIEEQLKQYDFNFKLKQVEKVSFSPESLWQLDCDREKFMARTVIIATGSRHKLLQVKGEKEFTGKGVSYCALCDAPFFKGKDVVVIGGGNTALEEALYLTGFANTVTIMHRRDNFRADKVLQERVKGNDKIKFIMNRVCVEITGQQYVQAVKVKDAQGQVTEISCAGVFIYIGMKPETDFLHGLLDTDEAGYIITDEKLQSSAKGIFACGDCRNSLLRQVITACGDGALAVYSARMFLDQRLRT